MKLIPREIDYIRLAFEDQLRRTRKTSKVEKMKMRSRIRKEMCHLLVCRNPTADRFFSRSELQLHDVFSISHSWFKDDLNKTADSNIKEKENKDKNKIRIKISVKPHGQSCRSYNDIA
jgi:hypothetical protein